MTFVGESPSEQGERNTSSFSGMPWLDRLRHSNFSFKDNKMDLSRYEVKNHEDDVNPIFSTDEYRDALAFRIKHGGVIMRNLIDYRGNEWQEVVDDD